MRKPAIQALSCWAGAFATVIALLLAFIGKPGTTDGASEAIGRTFAHTGIAALCVWLVARVSASPWSWLKFLAFYVAAFIGVSLVSTIGHVKSANGQPDDWPYKATFPDGWTVNRLRGASSAPQDESLGVREIARLDSGAGAPVIQLSCVWPDAHEPIDLDALVQSITDKIEAQYASPKTRVQTVGLGTLKIARHPTRTVMTKIFMGDDLVLEQESLVALTDRCIFSAQVGALPSEFEIAAAAFRKVIQTIQIE